MADFKQEFHNSEEIIAYLDLLDITCATKGIKADLVILGGAGIALVMALRERPFRMTRDIDVNILNTSDETEIATILKEFEIDIVGGVMDLPPIEDFREKENHLQIDADFEAIRVFVPSPEMLACAKLFTKREKDMLDLKNSELLSICDKEKLLSMVEEYKDYMLNPDDTFVNVHELVNLLAEKGI